MSVGFVCAQLAEAPGGAHTTTWDDHMLVRFRHVEHLGYKSWGRSQQLLNLVLVEILFGK